MSDRSEVEEAEEVRRQISAAFEHDLRACTELEAFAVRRSTPWQGRAIQKSSADEPPRADEVLALLYARATKTFKAELLLAREGYGEQAAMLNRSLFEGMAVAHSVVANEEAAAERFIRSWRFDRRFLGPGEPADRVEDKESFVRVSLRESAIDSTRANLGGDRCAESALAIP